MKKVGGGLLPPLKGDRRPWDDVVCDGIGCYMHAWAAATGNARNRWNRWTTVCGSKVLNDEILALDAENVRQHWIRAYACLYQHPCNLETGCMSVNLIIKIGATMLPLKGAWILLTMTQWISIRTCKLTQRLNKYWFILTYNTMLTACLCHFTDFQTWNELTIIKQINKNGFSPSSRRLIGLSVALNSMACACAAGRTSSLRRACFNQ